MPKCFQDVDEQSNSRIPSPNNNTVMTQTFPPPTQAPIVPSPSEQRRASQHNIIIQQLTSNPDFNTISSTGVINMPYHHTPHIQEYYPMTNGVKGIRTNTSANSQLTHSSSVSEPGGRSNSNRVITSQNSKQRRYNSSQNVAAPKPSKTTDQPSMHSNGRFSPTRYNHAMSHGSMTTGRQNKKRKPSGNPHQSQTQPPGGMPTKRPQEYSNMGRWCELLPVPATQAHDVNCENYEMFIMNFYQNSNKVLNYTTMLKWNVMYLKGIKAVFR